MYTKDMVFVNKKIFEVKYLTRKDLEIYLFLCYNGVEYKPTIEDGVVVKPRNFTSYLILLRSLGLVEYVESKGVWRPIINHLDSIAFPRDYFLKIMKNNITFKELLFLSLPRWKATYNKDFEMVKNSNPTLNIKIFEKFFGKERREIKKNFKEECEKYGVDYSLRFMNCSVEVELNNGIVNKPIDEETMYFNYGLIGEMFELIYGQHLERKGYFVKYRGIQLGREDGGIDLVVFEDGFASRYIQCKYWSKDKEIDEDVIIKTYESTVSIIKELNSDKSDDAIKKYITKNNLAMVVSHTTFTKKAKSTAKKLGVVLEENVDVKKLIKKDLNI